LIWLPIPILVRAGDGLGWLSGRLLKSRRGVVITNLRLCFPDREANDLEALADAHFRSLGRGIFETGLAWWAPDWRLRSRCSVEGLEHLAAAQAQGGVLLLTGHFTTLEIAARALCLAGVRFHAMYRPYSNPIFDYYMHRWRAQRSGLDALPREDLRKLVRALRDGRAIWYAPDQSISREAVFVDFFGVPSLTLTATARLARMGRAKVLPYFPRREKGRWVVRFEPAWAEYPSGDDEADARKVNAALERGVEAALPDYFWIHRRFKQRPPGEASIY
jgi:KDO2-lipid IV(A) lauroyltransferase